MPSGRRAEHKGGGRLKTASAGPSMKPLRSRLRGVMLITFEFSWIFIKENPGKFKQNQHKSKELKF